MIVSEPLSGIHLTPLPLGPPLGRQGLCRARDEEKDGEEGRSLLSVSLAFLALSFPWPGQAQP